MTFENGVWDRLEKSMRARQIYPCAAPLPGRYTAGSSVKVALAPYESKVIELAIGGFAKGTENLATGTCAGGSSGAAMEPAAVRR